MHKDLCNTKNVPFKKSKIFLVNAFPAKAGSAGRAAKGRPAEGPDPAQGRSPLAPSTPLRAARPAGRHALLLPCTARVEWSDGMTRTDD